MNPNRIAAIVILTVLGIAATLSAAYVVPEGRQAVITQFGRPIGTPVTSAGIHVKTCSTWTNGL